MLGLEERASRGDWEPWPVGEVRGGGVECVGRSARAFSYVPYVNLSSLCMSVPFVFT